MYSYFMNQNVEIQTKSKNSPQTYEVLSIGSNHCFSEPTLKVFYGSLLRVGWDLIVLGQGLLRG